METLGQNKSFCFQLERFVDKITFNFHSFNKIKDFVTTILYPSYINPQSRPTEDAMDKAQFSCLTRAVNRRIDD